MTLRLAQEMILLILVLDQKDKGKVDGGAGNDTLRFMENKTIGKLQQMLVVLTQAG